MNSRRLIHRIDRKSFIVSSTINRKFIKTNWQLPVKIFYDRVGGLVWQI